MESSATYLFRQVQRLLEVPKVGCYMGELALTITLPAILNSQTTLYYFRRLQCHDCVELKKEVKDINQKLKEDKAKFQKQVDELSEKMSRMCEMQTEAMKEAKQMMAEIRYVKHIMLCQYLTRQNIIIAGGEHDEAINSVEILSWPEKTWTLQTPMLGCRCGASTVVFEGDVYVTGGFDENDTTVDTIETSTCDEPLQWNISAVKLPVICRRHATVMYKDGMILSGGQTKSDETSDQIYEISMVPPYSTKVLTAMPEPLYDHTMELFEDKLFIFGGYENGPHDTVMMYNLTTEDWVMMTALPSLVEILSRILSGS